MGRSQSHDSSHWVDDDAYSQDNHKIFGQNNKPQKKYFAWFLFFRLLGAIYLNPLTKKRAIYLVSYYISILTNLKHYI